MSVSKEQQRAWDHLRKANTLWRVINGKQDGANFEDGEIVRLSEDDQGDRSRKYKHLDGRAFWWTDDSNVEHVDPIALATVGSRWKFRGIHGVCSTSPACRDHATFTVTAVNGGSCDCLCGACGQATFKLGLGLFEVADYLGCDAAAPTPAAAPVDPDACSFCNEPGRRVMRAEKAAICAMCAGLAADYFEMR